MNDANPLVGPLRDNAGATKLFGVVAIGRNEGERLRRCLASVLPQAALVVYIDSGSTDGSPAMAHALDDGAVVPANSQMFYEALRSHKVPAHYLELPSGGHGLNGYQGPMWDAWQEKSLAWLAELKLIPAAKTSSKVK